MQRALGVTLYQVTGAYHYPALGNTLLYDIITYKDDLYVLCSEDNMGLARLWAQPLKQNALTVKLQHEDCILS